MKTTGVIRRIDDLGRIVIPKEIRKSLRIKDGESLEIYLDSDNIVLKKFSRLEGLSDFYKNYVDSVQSSIGENIMITDNEKIVAVAGILRKNYLDRDISDYVENIIYNRLDVVEKDIVFAEIVKGVNEECTFAISPIIANGDAIGAVIILSKENKLDGFCEKAVKIAAKFLGKCIE